MLKIEINGTEYEVSGTATLVPLQKNILISKPNIEPYVEPNIEPDIVPHMLPNMEPSIVEPTFLPNKLVFAHYFPFGEISLDGVLPIENDYYSRGLLNPEGEHNKHLAYGGLWRDRPLPGHSGDNWHMENMKEEVRKATELGLDGFCFNVMNVDDHKRDYRALDKLCRAAMEVNPAFRIIIMPDMAAKLPVHHQISRYTKVFNDVKHYPCIMRYEGKIVIAPFRGEAYNADEWNSILKGFSDNGNDINLMAGCLGNVRNNYHSKGVPVFGYSEWGTVGLHNMSNSLKRGSGYAHSHGDKVWMAPITVQKSTPRAYNAYENKGSTECRAAWDAVITMDNPPDWIQLVTWCDYSENTQISPSVRTGNGFYELTKYYIEWFKTGKQPQAKDQLFYFYRAHSMDTDIAPKPEKQHHAFHTVKNSEHWHNEIEILAILTEPSVLVIEVDGNIHIKEVEAGIQSFSIPLEEGTPKFKIVRNRITIKELTGSCRIANDLSTTEYGYQDPTVRTGYK